MADTDPSATLSAIRERQALASDASLGFSRMDERHDALIKLAYEDTPLLVMLAEAVLALADEWDEEAREILDFKGIGASAYRACARACANDLREAITSALTGTPQLKDGHA